MPKSEPVPSGTKREPRLGVLWAVAISLLMWVLLAVALLRDVGLTHR
jgi:hypothetical protein